MTGYENRNKMDSIFVLLTDTGTLFTTLIKQFTSAPYNHASLALDEGLNDVYSFGRKRAGNPFKAGFVEEDVYEGTFRRFPATRCAVIRLKVTRQQRLDAVRFVHHFQLRNQDYRYNLIGLLGVLTNLEMKSKNAYFCSQFVAEALRHMGLSLWKQPPSLVTPNDFLLHSAFELIYEGFLYDYPLLCREKLSSATQDRTVPVIHLNGQAI